MSTIQRRARQRWERLVVEHVNQRIEQYRITIEMLTGRWEGVLDTDDQWERELEPHEAADELLDIQDQFDPLWRQRLT